MPAHDGPPEDDSVAHMDDLQRETVIIREDLGALVGELERRRHRAARPLTLMAVGLAGISVTGVVLWLALRRPPSRLRLLARALGRVAAHPDRVATAQPKATRKIVVAAASAAATVLARHLAKRWLSRRARAA